MAIFGEIKLEAKVAKRLGAFKCTHKQGMSIEEACTYSDQLYPPTTEDIPYDDELRGQSETGTSGFPQFNALSLLPPISATMYIAISTPAPFMMIAEHGLTNLG